jgi:hypothetical protein
VDATEERKKKKARGRLPVVPQRAGPLPSGRRLARANPGFL